MHACMWPVQTTFVCSSLHVRVSNNLANNHFIVPGNTMATETGTGMQPLLATQELLHGLAASLALSCTKQKTSPNLDFVTDVITGARVTGYAAELFAGRLGSLPNRS